MGPEKFLRLLPLDLDAEDITDGNVWVLPILKQYTVGAELHFFSQHILKMVKLLKQKSLKVFIFLLDYLINFISKYNDVMSY